MKKYFKPAVFSIVLSVAITIAHAQQQDNVTNNRNTPQWVSDKGYWVIESNIKTPKSAIVYFYNNDNQLVYKEAIVGVKLNTRRAKTKIKLTKAMENAVWAYNQKQPLKDKEQVVAFLFR